MLERFILLSMAGIHFLMTVLSFFLFKQYEFMEPMKSLLIQNFFWSVLLFFNFYLGNEEKFVKKFKVGFIGYVFFLIIIVTYTFIILPQFTYEEATRVVEIETGKQVLEPQKGALKEQLGQYFIYTTDDVYIFNAETGSYGVSDLGSNLRKGVNEK